jgi:glyoxylase-like metal-dependent hydrolase (beta-lactamase superfamily II)
MVKNSRSHCHFDHTGNVDTFPPSVKLVLGPGTQQHSRPAYPINPDSAIHEADYL